MRSISTRFLLTIGTTVSVFALAVIGWTVFDHVRLDRVQQERQLELAHVFGASVRQYIRHHVRPVMREFVKEEDFIPETMSSTFATRRVFEEVQQRYPDYLIKFSSENPREPTNRISEDERRVADFFRQYPDQKVWRGTIDMKGRKWRASVRVDRFNEGCMRCHGDPADAPRALLARYGETHGFGNRPGDIAALQTVAIPVDERHAALVANILVQATIVTVGIGLLFGVVATTFRRQVGERLTNIARHFERFAHSGDTRKLADLPAMANDEIGRMARSFNTLAQRLRSIHGELEDRVARRTEELTGLNDRLQVEADDRLAAQREAQEQTTFLQALLNTIPSAIFYKDKHGRYLMCNDTFFAWTGYGREEVIGRTVWDLYPPEVAEKYAEADAVLLTHAASQEYEFKIRHREGGERDVIFHKASCMDDHGAVTGLVGIATDITDRLDIERELRQERDFADSLIETAQTIVLVLDADGKVVRLNDFAEGLIGYQMDDLAGRDWIDAMVPQRERQCVRQVLKDALAGQLISSQVNPIVLRDGTERQIEWYSRSLTNEKGETTNVLAVGYDITERLATEQALRESREEHRHNAEHDSLTGLYNRPKFMALLEEACRRAKDEAGYEFVVLFLDLDRFKLINDSMGHDIGDLLLKSITRRLTDGLGEGCDCCAAVGQRSIARLGGDEFVLLLGGRGSTDHAEKIATCLQERLNKPHYLNGNQVFASASIGIVTSATAGDDSLALLRDADTAMYRAKRRGRACHAMFDQHMHEEATAALRLENDLRDALNRDELHLWYQPIVSLEGDGCCGFETLLRWRHSKLGLIGPDRFIPIAEETGLIVPLGRWLLTAACRQLRQWHRRFDHARPLYLSVNVSKKQLMDEGFPDQVAAILQDTGLAPRSLRIEITESVIMEDVDVIVRGLARLKELGVDLMMDDFGTGYSSLSRLHEFPIDAVKIDRSFIDSMTNNRQFSAIVHAIISLADNLDMKVIAEGVETEDQVAQLVAMECNMAQGYFFAHPMPPEEATGYLASHAPMGVEA